MFVPGLDRYCLSLGGGGEVSDEELLPRTLGHKCFRF